MSDTIIKVIVAAWNANGEPDLFFCKVQCTDEQYNDGQHYRRAMELAHSEGYECSPWATDQYDPVFPALSGHFVWDSASVVEV